MHYVLIMFLWGNILPDISSQKVLGRYDTVDECYDAARSVINSFSTQMKIGFKCVEEK